MDCAEGWEEAGYLRLSFLVTNGSFNGGLVSEPQLMPLQVCIMITMISH